MSDIQFTISRKKQFTGCATTINVQTPVGTVSVGSGETYTVVSPGDYAEIIVEEPTMFRGTNQRRFIIRNGQCLYISWTAFGVLNVCIH